MTSRSHLVAAIAAIGITGISLAVWNARCLRVEQENIQKFVNDFSEVKLQGVALQKAALRDEKLLMFYGSSEVSKKIPNIPSEFFQKHSRGFQVFSVGKAGSSALTFLQRISSLGSSLAGRKVAISLSPSLYFNEVNGVFQEKLDYGYYAGNFSHFQLLEFVFSTKISRELKSDIAKRLLEFPETLKDQWLLKTALEHLAQDSFLDKIVFAALRPLGAIQLWVAQSQDHFQVAQLEGAASLAENHDQLLSSDDFNWQKIMAQGEQITKEMRIKKPLPPLKNRFPAFSRDNSFLEAMNRSEEWADTELLLRTLRELGAKPVFISMPMHTRDLEDKGISIKSQQAFVERLRALMAHYEMPFVYFDNQEEASDFFFDRLDHPSAKGWVYYNQALENFYRGRIL